MKPETIIVNDIRVTAGNRVLLDGINFQLLPGEQLAITGKSGSGKTTLARVLAGLQYAKGTIAYKCDDKNCSPKVVYMAASETWKNHSNVSDFYYQQRFNSCDAEDVETVFASLSRSAKDLTGVQQWLRHFSMEHRAATPLIQLSSGEQKKLQLIRALLQEPDVLILDQPFSGLDAASRSTLEQVLAALANHTRIILVTDHKTIPAFITHVAMLENGRLHAWSTRENFHYRQEITDEIRIDLLQLPRVEHAAAPVISMEDVTIQHGQKKLLNNINWTVYGGEGWLIRGHNGAGKSTLLSLVTADNPQAYSQRVQLFGRKRGSGESIWDIKKQVGLVSPELHKYFDRGTSVYQAIGSGFSETMGLFKPLSSTQHKQVMQWITVLNLAAVKDNLLSALPDSQQRWVLIARAMVKNPAILALDEPCQGLDVVQTAQFLKLVEEVHRHTGVTLLYITHYAGEIPASVNNILELENGNVRLLHHAVRPEAVAS